MSVMVTLRMDESLNEAVRAYAYTNRCASVSEAYRMLVEDAIAHTGGRPYAAPVRQQVKEELDSFASRAGLEMQAAAADVLDDLDMSLSAGVSLAARASLAALRAACMAAEAAGCGTADEVEERAWAAASAAGGEGANGDVG